MEEDLQDGRREALSGVAICRLADLPDRDARTFTVDAGKGARKIVVVRRDGAVFGYLNRCPHEGIPLDWGTVSRLVDRDCRHLICHAHSAYFEIEDGFCVEGPCAGDMLEPVAVRIEGDIIVLSGDG